MRLTYICLLIFCVIICFAPHSGIAQEDIRDIPLDSLLNMRISTASKYNQTMNEAPASVTIITSEDIERYGYRTLEDVFAGVRGFYISNDRNYSYVGVRGFGRPTDYNNRILLLIDGHTLNEGVFGSAYETETTHYLLTNFNISTKPLFNRLKFSFLVRNVFDAEYGLPGGFEHLQPAIAQNGRNFAVELGYSF